jgi:hypothetical protein
MPMQDQYCLQTYTGSLGEVQGMQEKRHISNSTRFTGLFNEQVRVPLCRLS